ncbi:hypothetical protein J6590_066881 [Homalodisca vitripennis]|nr:hypothetical protein J6590_066881 [Homalodisca vitripennis]
MNLNLCMNPLPPIKECRIPLVTTPSSKRCEMLYSWVVFKNAITIKPNSFEFCYLKSKSHITLEGQQEIKPSSRRTRIVLFRCVTIQYYSILQKNHIPVN